MLGIMYYVHILNTNKHLFFIECTSINMFHQVQIGKQNRIEWNNNSSTVKKNKRLLLIKDGNTFYFRMVQTFSEFKCINPPTSHPLSTPHKKRRQTGLWA